jgi:hypothetical protein
MGLNLFSTYVKTDSNPDGIIPSEYNLTKNSLKIKEEDLLIFKQWYINNRKTNKTENTI